MKIFILNLILCSAIFAGCTDTVVGLDISDVLIVDTESIDMNSNGGQSIIEIAAHCDWVMTSTEKWSWITTSAKTGDKGAKSVAITIAENTMAEPREATISIKNVFYGFSHDIVVAQNGAKPAISISKGSITASVEGGKDVVTVTSNIPWTASCSADWVTLSHTKGEKGETTLNITTKENVATTDRTATVKITNSEYGKTATINIKQQGCYAILYTSSNGSVVTPGSSTGFGANIVSNTYEDGQGVILFDAPITSIGEDAFSYCSSLTSITIPDGVTSIGDMAFYQCWFLTSITIPDSVTSIGDDAFCYCYSLTSVTIGNSVTLIGSYVFGDCDSLTSITIPDSVTSIGGGAFAGCTSLTSVTIPNSVTSIGEFAFCDCESLTSVYCKATTPPTGDHYMFDANVSGIKIYVPRNSVEAYKAATYWRDYASYIEGYDF